jgi:hypothetical protein
MSARGTFAPWRQAVERDGYWGHTCRLSAHQVGALQILKVVEPR